MKYFSCFILALFLPLIATAQVAVRIDSLNLNQFGTNGNKVSVKSGALQTNIDLYGITDVRSNLNVFGEFVVSNSAANLETGFQVLTNNRVIGGFVGNFVDPTASDAVIAGGGHAFLPNRILSGGNSDTAIGGGHLNTIGLGDNNSSVIGGGFNNIISNSANDAVIAGGEENRINGGQWSVIGGGYANTIIDQISGTYSFIPGGRDNIVSNSVDGFAIGSDNFVFGSKVGMIGWANRGILLTNDGNTVTITGNFTGTSNGTFGGTVTAASFSGPLASDPNLTNANAYASSTTVVPLQIILPSGMLTNGLEILDSAGTILWSVGSNGTQRIFGTTNSSLILYAPDGTTAQISLNNGNITNTGILSVAGAASIGGLLSAAGNAAIIGNVTVGTGGAGGSWLVNGQIVLPTAGGVTIGTSANNNSPRIARAGTGLEYGASIEVLGAGGARGSTNNIISSGKLWMTNGVASFAANATNAVAASGWTNTYLVNAAVRIEGTAVVITIKNAAQTVLDTYTLTGDIEHNLQPGHAITAAAGLTGTARPW